jgi:hypothetical protein
MNVQIRIGVEGRRLPVFKAIQELGAGILISANSLWSSRRQRFVVPANLRVLDVALDSGGFIAMKRYGGYRWTVAAYTELARDLAPAWWAQMDFCCEPEIAGERAEVFRRIDRTVEHLHACQAEAARVGAPAPLPVLQGWRPADYCQGPAYDPGFVWPALVGVGSVCRRSIRGPHGILSVMDALDRAVPAGVKFHLFGVKSGAVTEILVRWPHRLSSVDSMAWNLASWWDAHHAGIAHTNDFRAATMKAWYLKQLPRTVPPPQLTLL